MYSSYVCYANLGDEPEKIDHLRSRLSNTFFNAVTSTTATFHTFEAFVRECKAIQKNLDIRNQRADFGTSRFQRAKSANDAIPRNSGRTSSGTPSSSRPAYTPTQNAGATMVSGLGSSWQNLPSQFRDLPPLDDTLRAHYRKLGACHKCA